MRLQASWQESEDTALSWEDGASKERRIIRTVRKEEHKTCSLRLYFVTFWRGALADGWDYSIILF